MFSFSKIERLCSKKSIENLFANGQSKTQFPIKLIYTLSEFESPFPVRAMFVVPKKKHKRANQRNVLKRRMREIYRLNKHELYQTMTTKKYDIMFVYLSNEACDYETIKSKMIFLLNQLKEKNKQLEIT
jgi:ribonuclease P protein component